MADTQCSFLGGQKAIDITNYTEVPRDTTDIDVIYFMESDGAHAYFGQPPVQEQVNNNE